MIFSKNDTQKHYADLSKLNESELIQRIKSAGSPTDTALAEALWHGLSGNNSSFPGMTMERAKKVYQACGYKPFRGFPLTKAHTNLPNHEPNRMQYKCGWNNLVYGINHWSSNQEKWKDALEWAIHCAGIAVEMIPKAKGSHNVAHYQGVIDAAEYYKEVGSIDRIE